MQSELQSKIGKLDAAEYESTSRFEQELLAMSKERDMIEVDAAEKLKVISELISENNQMIQEINELTLWKEETVVIMKRGEKEKLASDVLVQRIVDLGNNLEHYQTKYHKSMRALAELEEALLVRTEHVFFSSVPSILSGSFDTIPPSTPPPIQDG